MIYKNGTKLTDRESGDVFVVSGSNAEETSYQGASGRGTVKTSEVAALFEVDGVAEALSALDTQVGGTITRPWAPISRGKSCAAGLRRRNSAAT